MAVRFNANGQSYSRTLSLGTTSAFTVTCWARKQGTGSGADSALWSVGSGVIDYVSMKFRFDANSLITTWAESGGTHFYNWVAPYSLQEWVFVGLSFGPPNDLRIVSRQITASSFSEDSSTFDAITVSGSSLMLGQSHGGGEWLNGTLAAVKVWTAELTADEMKGEAWSYLPRRTSNLRAWYPFLTPETVDYSGQAQTLSGGAGTAVEDGPGISWGLGRRRLWRPAPLTLAGLPESAAAADSLSVSTAASLADARSAVEQLVATTTVPLAESASNADALTATVSLAVTDTGSASESMTAGVPKPLTDTATSVDTVSVTGGPALAQAGAAADTLTATATGAFTQTGSAADTITGGPLLAKALTDTANGADTFIARLQRDIGRIHPPRRAWTAARPARAWTAGDPGRAWEAAVPRRRYSAGPPRTR